MSPGRRIFLLSPANCSGRRAEMLVREGARSPIAQRLRSRGGAALGEVFAFVSGLYFRGKLAYASAFANPPEDCPGAQIIVPGLGLCPPSTPIRLRGLLAIARVPVDPANRRYLRPLQRDAARLAGQMAGADTAILLGSIATPKYLGPLEEILGPRLSVPREFIGLGEMSRGSLMLRSAAAGRELRYVPAFARA